MLSEIEESGTHHLLLEVPTTLTWFSGHFPENPVLPGVAQLHWAVIASNAIFSTHKCPRESKRLKFKSVVVPPRVIELVLRKVGTDQVQFRFYSLRQDHSEGCLAFAG